MLACSSFERLEVTASFYSSQYITGPLNQRKVRTALFCIHELTDSHWSLQHCQELNLWVSNDREVKEMSAHTWEIMRYKSRRIISDHVHDTEFSLALSLQGWHPVAVVLSSFFFLLGRAVERLWQEINRSKIQVNENTGGIF